MSVKGGGVSGVKDLTTSLATPSLAFLCLCVNTALACISCVRACMCIHIHTHTPNNAVVEQHNDGVTSSLAWLFLAEPLSTYIRTWVCVCVQLDQVCQKYWLRLTCSCGCTLARSLKSWSLAMLIRNENWLQRGPTRLARSLREKGHKLTLQEAPIKSKESSMMPLLMPMNSWIESGQGQGTAPLPPFASTLPES